MVIICIPKITAIDIPNKIVRAECDISVDDGPVHKVCLMNADISTPAKKIEAANTI